MEYAQDGGEDALETTDLIKGQHTENGTFKTGLSTVGYFLSK